MSASLRAVTAVSQHDFVVEQLSSAAQFVELQAAWREIQALDSQASIFLSWEWLSAWQEGTGSTLQILACRQRSTQRFVAFLPLAYRPRAHWYASSELQVGAWPLADYNGPLCLPEYQEQVLPLLADYLAHHLKWDRLRAEDLDRAGFVSALEGLPAEKFLWEPVPPNLCPQLELPASWLEYESGLTANFRQQLRNSQRKTAALPEYREVRTTAENFPVQVEALLQLWQARFGYLPGDQRQAYTTLFRRMLEAAAFSLWVLWSRGQPLAASACFIDAPRRAYRQYLTCFDQQHSATRPGRVVLARSIREAVEAGYRLFDFCRGEEGYKYLFGAVAHTNRNLLITRRGFRQTLREWRGRRGQQATAEPRP